MNYVYAFRLRGYSIGCQPKGNVSWSDKFFRHGVVVYDRKLTDKEVADYELEQVRASDMVMDANDKFNHMKVSQTEHMEMINYINEVTK